MFQDFPNHEDVRSHASCTSSLATNFHQGWDLEADDWPGIVDNYVNANPAAETQRKIAQEITTCARPNLNLIWPSS